MRATESPTIRAAEAPAETPMTRADWQRLISEGVNSNTWVDRFDSATIAEAGNRTMRDDLTPLMRSESEMNDALKMLGDLEKTGHLDPADVAFVREADNLITEANEFGKAAEVAAMCLMRGS